MLTSLKKIIGVDIKTPLTLKECSYLLFDKFPVMTTRQIQNIPDFVKYVMEQQAVCLLVIDEDILIRSGHYVAFTYNKDRNLLSYYDSYASDHTVYKNDKLNDIISYCKQNRQNTRFEVNTEVQQRLSRNVSNCGRYVCLRCLNNDMSNNEFNKMIDQTIHIQDSDTLCCLMTAIIGMYDRNKD